MASQQVVDFRKDAIQQRIEESQAFCAVYARVSPCTHELVGAAFAKGIYGVVTQASAVLNDVCAAGSGLTYAKYAKYCSVQVGCIGHGFEAARYGWERYSLTSLTPALSFHPA